MTDTDRNAALPTPPAAWDEYAMREAQRLWNLPPMPRTQMVACVHVTLVDAMRFALGRQEASGGAVRDRIISAYREHYDFPSFSAMHHLRDCIDSELDALAPVAPAPSEPAARSEFIEYAKGELAAGRFVEINPEDRPAFFGEPAARSDAQPVDERAARLKADDPAEYAYWTFDARRKGYGPWKQCPQSERDAFKTEYRAALAQSPAPQEASPSASGVAERAKWAEGFVERSGYAASRPFVAPQSPAGSADAAEGGAA